MEQDKLLKIILVAVAVFAIVTAGGAMYFFQDRAMLQAQLKELAKQVTAEQSQEEMARPQLTLNSSAPAISGGDKEMQDIVARLEAEKAGLEAENATLKKRLDEALREEAPGQSASDQRRAARRRRDPRQELEELRETDPEEYERRVSEMQAWQQRMQQRQENITNYLANLDTSKLSQDQRDLLQDYQTVRAEMQAAMADPENMDRDEMRDLGREMFEMSQSVREILYEQLAGQLGTDAASLTENIDMIQSATGFGGGPGGPGRGPGGPGRGFGGGRGPGGPPGRW